MDLPINSRKSQYGASSPLSSAAWIVSQRGGRADELEGDIKKIRGGDEAAALRRLEDDMGKLKAAFKEVKGLAQGAQEAAAKCQVLASAAAAAVWCCVNFLHCFRGMSLLS